MNPITLLTLICHALALALAGEGDDEASILRAPVIDPAG